MLCRVILKSRMSIITEKAWGFKSSVFSKMLWVWEIQHIPIYLHSKLFWSMLKRLQGESQQFLATVLVLSQIKCTWLFLCLKEGLFSKLEFLFHMVKLQFCLFMDHLEFPNNKNKQNVYELLFPICYFLPTILKINSVINSLNHCC